MLNKKLWILLSLVMLILVACGQNDQHKQEDKQSNQSDSNSKEHSYKRIVSLMPSNTEILYELGLEKILWVFLQWTITLKMLKREKQFDTMNLNKEALLKVKPDLILAHESQKERQRKY